VRFSFAKKRVRRPNGKSSPTGTGEEPLHGSQSVEPVAVRWSLGVSRSDVISFGANWKVLLKCFFEASTQLVFRNNEEHNNDENQTRRHQRASLKMRHGRGLLPCEGVFAREAFVATLAGTMSASVHVGCSSTAHVRGIQRTRGGFPLHWPYDVPDSSGGQV
jgi:hypothetical protein